MTYQSEAEIDSLRERMSLIFISVVNKGLRSPGRRRNENNKRMNCASTESAATAAAHVPISCRTTR